MNTFIFDLDGTLLNTLGDIANACNALLKRHGYPQHQIDEYKQMVGNGFTKMVERALPPDVGNALDAAGLAALVRETGHFYEEHMTELTEPYVGMEEILRAIIAKGSSVAILSNKPDEFTIKLAEHFFPDVQFTFAHGARADTPLKPHPASLSGYLIKYAITPANAFYTGDSAVDIITGHNANMLGVGACWGFRGREELSAAGADILLDTPCQLLGLTEIPPREDK